MTKEKITINSFNGHRMLLKDDSRRDGNNVYEDLEDGSRVTCSEASLIAHPRRTAPFEPVRIGHDA